jgi:ornithine cyclodeaminase/alanine dehydrogenase-like protein (mu-crystallin family)
MRDAMTLIINNDDVAKVLTMEDTLEALERSYLALAAKEAVCRPRIDIRIPTSDPARNYQWGTMEGGSTAGYFAIRMKSDIIYETQYNGVITQEKYCSRPGLFCGLILLTSIENGEFLAFINDGHLQHMRVGADGGIGVKYMANADAEVVGILGSGGMARTHMQAFTRVRTIKKLQVFSPTTENREAFGREMAAKYNIEVKVCDRPEEVYKGAHIVAALTDSAVTVTDGALLEKGAHIVVVGGTGKPDAESLGKVDVYLRFGDTPSPDGHPELATDAEFLAYEARPDRNKFGDGRRKRAHGVALPDKRITLADLVQGRTKGRTSPDQITYSERGNLQGAQFYAIAGRVYELVKRAGLGREIPTEWFLQDIRN